MWGKNSGVDDNRIHDDLKRDNYPVLPGKSSPFNQFHLHDLL